MKEKDTLSVKEMNTQKIRYLFSQVRKYAKK